MKWACIFLLCVPALTMLADDIELTGTVVSLNDRPVGGVNVIVKGTARATVTDMNGYFRLRVEEGKVVLLFMFQGRKGLQHPMILGRDSRYQIHVTLASRIETFNRSRAITSELPIDGPVISGYVKDENGLLLEGVVVKQNRSGFIAKTNSDGHFTLPVPEGENQISFVYGTAKALNIELNVQTGVRYFIEATIIGNNTKLRHRQSSANVSSTPAKENQ